MRLGVPLRHWGRQLIIRGAAALHLDGLDDVREAQVAARPPLVRVLFLHGTPDEHAFRALLFWLRQRFTLIDFDTFDRLLSAAAGPLPGPAVLLTFDDGLVSNYRIAARVLEEAGARGLFFVVPGFSQTSGESAQRFYVERLRGTRFEPAMTPAQIADLAARGHTIGNHTYSHAWLSRTPASAYAREIDESAALLESWIGKPVDAFAWPFVWNGITAEAHRRATARHRYCFSPCSGRVVAGLDTPELIWRTNVEIWSPPAERRFQCSGLADRASAGRRRRLRRWLQGEASAASHAA